MTHGEAWYIASIKKEINIVDGCVREPKNLPPRMSRQGAVKYYNTKLYNYWLDILNQESPNRKKKNAMWVKIQMFGHPQNTKLLEKDAVCGD